ncbi:polysaccharide deacetylase family protein, partial [Mycobacteroides abscessus subsp. massiliense]
MHPILATTPTGYWLIGGWADDVQERVQGCPPRVWPGCGAQGAAGACRIGAGGGSVGTVLDSVRFQIAAVAVVLVAAAGVVGIGVRHRLLLGPDTVDCSRYKCVALTFD